MNNIQQLDLWVEGMSLHNQETDTCCPDFSCCGGQLVHQSKRIMFRDAYVAGKDDVVESLLSEFLVQKEL